MSKQTELAQLADAVTVSSGNVGIGTSSPSGASGTTLAINGGAGQSRLALKNNATGDASGDGFQLSIGTDGSVGIEQRENLYMAFYTNALERMRLHSDGGVAINRDNSGTEPYIALTLSNTVTSAGLALDCNDGSTGKKWEIQSNPDGQLITYCRDTNLYTSKHHSIGAVTTPNQPRFSAGLSTQTNYTNGSTVIFAVNVYNPTSNYNSSNGRFTAPIDGFYQFNIAVRYQSAPSTGAYLRIRPHKNGGHMEYIVGDPIQGSFMANQTYGSTTMSFSCSLAANDYIEVKMDNAGGQTVPIANSGWSGYLVG